MHRLSVTPPPPRISIDAIKRITADEFSVSAMDMVSDRRADKPVLARQVAMFLAREMTPHSYPGIGRCFGNRDHTTVMHGVRKIEAAMAQDAELRGRVNRIRARLEAA